MLFCHTRLLHHSHATRSGVIRSRLIHNMPRHPSQTTDKPLGWAMGGSPMWTPTCPAALLHRCRTRSWAQRPPQGAPNRGVRGVPARNAGRTHPKKQCGCKALCGVMLNQQPLAIDDRTRPGGYGYGGRCKEAAANQ